MRPYLTNRFSLSFRWYILALRGCAMLWIFKSCFCATVCPSHFPLPLLPLVSTEVGKYLHRVSQCENSIFSMRNARRSPLKQDHLQPHFHSKARQLSTQVYNGLLLLLLSQKFKTILLIRALKMDTHKLAYKSYELLALGRRQRWGTHKRSTAQILMNMLPQLLFSTKMWSKKIVV